MVNNKMTAKKAEVKQSVSEPTTTATPPATKPEPTPAPNRQQLKLTELKEAWAKRGVNLSKLEAVVDGKFLNVIPAAGWPVIRLGPTGGLDLPQIKSYAKAFDAAVHGDELLAKQAAREQKKAAASVPAPKSATTAPAEKKESTTARKQRQTAEIENRLAEARA